MELTEITVSGIRVLEPVTAGTNLITSSVCYYAFYQLHKLGRQEWPHIFLKFYLLFMGSTVLVSAFFGHAFLYLLGYNAKAMGWVLSGTGMLCIENASILSIRGLLGERWTRTLRILTLIQYVVFLTALLFPETRNFTTIKINSSLSLVGFVLTTQLYGFWHTKNKGRAFLIGGIVYGIIPAIVYNNEISLHKWFNYHDISHILMAINMYIMFLGAWHLKLGPEAEPRPETLSVHT